MLGIPTAVHRIKLLWEAGMPHRLSTRILVSAFNLYARIQLLPETHPCKHVLQSAVEASGTWARTVSLHLTELEVQDPVQWNSTRSACQTPEARKRRVKKYMQEVIGPAMHAKEQACQRLSCAGFLTHCLLIRGGPWPTQEFLTGGYSIGHKTDSAHQLLQYENRVSGTNSVGRTHV